MNALRLPLTLCATLAVVAGCGGSQPPIGAPGVMPQSATTAGRAHRATSGDLLYVATAEGILILTYPGAVEITKIPNQYYSPFVCPDPNTASIFVVTDVITEYARGGTTPIATLTVPSGFTGLGGCSIDRVTGNLAVATTKGLAGAVLMFPRGTGTPTGYEDPSTTITYYPAYDSHGNLFVAASSPSGKFVLTELRKAKTTFRDLTLSEDPGFGYKIQWDNDKLLIPAFGSGGTGNVYRLSIKGSSATIKGRTPLNKVRIGYVAFWVDGDTVIAPLGKIAKNNNQRLGIWNYPEGGNAVQGLSGLTKGRKDNLNDLTVSSEPP